MNATTGTRSAIVDNYITVLERQLAEQARLTPGQVALITGDVRRRLVSLLARWPDRAWRRTMLFHGVEEATFYEPQQASLDARALAVVAVRNSLIEDLGLSKPFRPELAGIPVRQDSLMPLLTRAAAECFYLYGLGTSDKDLAGPGVLPDVPNPAEDVFGSLATRYPIAWHAMAAAAALDRSLKASYEPVAAPRPSLPPEPARAHKIAGTVEATLSGIDPCLDDGLLGMLTAMSRADLPAGFAFFSDSFKFITRAPEKLYLILEYVLASGWAAVTANYYLFNGYVARRRRLLRPAHDEQQMHAKLRQRDGLTTRHQQALRATAAQSGVA